jgi:hypothetical protein
MRSASKAPIKTTGLGACGINVCDGSLNEATVKSITITRKGTGEHRSASGGTGESLAECVIMPHSAIALSVNPSGQFRELADWIHRSAQEPAEAGGGI